MDNHGMESPGMDNPISHSKMADNLTTRPQTTPKPAGSPTSKEIPLRLAPMMVKHSLPTNRPPGMAPKMMALRMVVKETGAAARLAQQASSVCSANPSSQKQAGSFPLPSWVFPWLS